MVYKMLELDGSSRCRLEGLEIGLTSNCNFRCDYCCAYQRNDGRFLEAERILPILEDLPDLKRVRLSGGEVTLRFEDCLKIVKYCASRGVHTQLNSNATLLNPEKLDRLEEAGLTSLHVSFNFTDPDSFSAYYQVSPDLFHKIVENVRYSVTKGFDTVLETLLFADTCGRLLEIDRFIYDLGVRIHEIQNGIAMPHTGWHALPTPEELKRAVNRLIDGKPDDMTVYLTCMDRFADRIGIPHGKNVHIARCIEGITQLHLHSNGDILISELCHPVVIGNVFAGTSLRDIYARMPPELREYLDRRPCPALAAAGFSGAD